MRKGVGDRRTAVGAALAFTALSIVIGRAGWLGNASDFGSGFFLGVALVAYGLAIVKLRQGSKPGRD